MKSAGTMLLVVCLGWSGAFGAWVQPEVDTATGEMRPPAIEQRLAGFLTEETEPAWHGGTNAIYEAISNATPANYAAVSNAAMSSVQTDDAAYLAAITNLTGTGGITVSGTGRSRAIDGSAFVQTEEDPGLAAWLLTDPLAGFLTEETEPAWHGGTNAIYEAISNATPANYAAVSNAAMSSVQTDDAAYLAAITNLTGTGGITVSGTGRSRALDGSAFLQASSHRVYVDWRNETGEEDGSLRRPYSTLQAALDAVGAAETFEDYTNGTQYAEVIVAPGNYGSPETSLVIPFRPFLHIDLSAARVDANVVWAMRDRPSGSTVPNLVISGSSLRSGHSQDPQGASIGIQGDVVIEQEGSWVSSGGAFYRLTLNRVAVMGGIYAQPGPKQHLYLHVFLDHAHVAGIHTVPASEPNTVEVSSLTLFATGWNMGHQYGGNTGQGIGGISGRVIPYNLQSTYISMGMDLNTPWGLGCIWHNVVFEAAEGVSYVVTNAPNMVVRTDLASYNSWMAATTPESRGNWHAEEGGNMVITDAPALDQVAGLQDELDGKAGTNHVHAIAGVTGLQDALDAPITWMAITNLASSVTITNSMERPILFTGGTNTVSISFAGLRSPAPLYFVARGPAAITFPDAHIVGGGSWQPDRKNHFVVWTYGGETLINPVTTTEDEE